MSIILAVLTSIAFSLPVDLIDAAEIGVRMPGGTFAEKLTAFIPVLGERMFPQCMLYFLLFWVLYREMLKQISRRGYSIAALLTSLVFSVFTLAGECTEEYGDLSFLFLNVPQCLITALKFTGFFLLFYTTVFTGFILMDERSEQPVRGRLGEVLFERHCFICPLMILLFCWLPYAAAFYPGFIPSDGLKQLNNFYGLGNFTDNHPAFSSMLMGWAMHLGRALGSDNLGVFLYTGPQLLINVAVMACCFPLYKDMRTPSWLRWVTLSVFALIPVWPNYAFTLLKDSLYMAMVLFFVIGMIRLIRDPEGFCRIKRNLVLLTVSLFLMVMVRHEGQFIAALPFFSLFTLAPVRKQWKKLLPVILIPLLCINGFDRVIRPAMNIPSSPAREALTLPFRQTSAVVIQMEDSLTEKESAVLHEVFEYDSIPTMYRLNNADPLKGLFDPWAKPDAVLRYLKVWLGLGIRHPLLYLNVFLCSNSHYYYPFVGPYEDIYGWFGIVQESYVNQGLFDLHYAERTAVLRSVIENIAAGLPKLPLTSLFYSLGLNAWVMIFCLAYLLRNKIRGIIIPLLPGIMTFVLIQNSAINGFFRYMLPLLITLPVCTAWTLSQQEKANTAAETDQLYK